MVTFVTLVFGNVITERTLSSEENVHYIDKIIKEVMKDNEGSFS